MRHVLFWSIFAGSHALLCIHNEKGYCRGHDIWGWCFHNKTSEEFNCDESNFCGKQELLQNKKSNGCFKRDEDVVCCCNDADGCNLGFIQSPPKYAGAQACYNSMEEPHQDMRLFKPCDDPWCFAYLTAEAAGGLTTVVRGCHSRKLVMHNMFLDEDKKFHNNSRWESTEVLAEQPTCDEIARDADYENGTQSLCYDFNFRGEDDEEQKGRLCCCRGTNKCNEKFLWADYAITKEELERIQAARTPLTSSVISNMLLVNSMLLLLISLYGNILPEGTV